MLVSVIDPIGIAAHRTKMILFAPFSAVKWLTLGFCAFLAYLTEGGAEWAGEWRRGREDTEEASSDFIGKSTGGDFGSFREFLESQFSWVNEHLWWILAVALVSAVTFVTVYTLIIWLQSRGKFMFLDGIVRNRAAVAEPWEKQKTLGNSLFGFWLFLAVMTVLSLLLIGVTTFLIAWSDIKAEEFGSSAMIALITGGLMTLTAVITFVLVFALLEDFVIPTMYLRRCLVMDAWAAFRYELLADHIGVIALFLLFRILLLMALGTLATIVVLMTCCVALLPYIGTVILLPLFVFNRCYTLCFIEQFGDKWRFFTDQNRSI